MDNQPNQTPSPSSENQSNGPTQTPSTSSVYPTPTDSRLGASPQANSDPQVPAPSVAPVKKSFTKILIYIVAVIIVAGLAFVAYDHFKPKQHQASGSVTANGYSSHILTVGGQTFRISFDKNATSRTVDAKSTLLSGNDLAGNKIIVGLTAIPSSSVVASDPCSAVFETGSATVIGTVTILNSSSSLCGSKPDSTITQSNGIIGAHFQSKSQWYKLVFNIYPNATYSVDVNTAKQVAESITTQ